MQVQINKAPGLKNELAVVVPRSEIDAAILHIANRAKFMALPGMVRHAPFDKEQSREVGLLKPPVLEHFRQLICDGKMLFGPDGEPLRRMVAIGARNLGNNHGAIAWQRDQSPRLFHIHGDPLQYSSHSCLVLDADKRPSIRDLHFAGDQVFEGGRDISDEAVWCVSGSPVLRAGRVLGAAEVIERFYDIRHILAFDEKLPEGRRIKEGIYENYPVRFRENSLRALHDLGVPRQRYLHNCIGLSEEKLIILQNEGTVEEVGSSLKAAGAQDGLILDNGGSVFCWAWWPYPNGGFIFTAPDFRPGSSAIIAFVLHGPVRTALPGGSVSFTVV
jgi:hypothetical protein